MNKVKFLHPSKDLHPSKEPVVQRAIESAAHQTGFKVSDITGWRRDRPLAATRFGVMAALKNAGLSSTEIGVALNRDHSSVLWGVRRAKEMRRRDREYDAYVGEIGRAIG